MQFDGFLSHDWGEDEGGRNNHARVARVCANLKKEGLRPWFDEERMRGDINNKMTDGIEGSGCVVCFITKSYIQKAGGKGPKGADDNCKCEFDYALRRKGVEKMIVVVMEKGCRNTKEWTGAVGAKLGGTLYIDLSEDGDAFDAKVKQLSVEIRDVVGSADIDDKINDELSAASTTSCKSQGEEAAAALRELSLGEAVESGQVPAAVTPPPLPAGYFRLYEKNKGASMVLCSGSGGKSGGPILFDGKRAGDDSYGHVKD